MGNKLRKIRHGFIKWNHGKDTILVEKQQGQRETSCNFLNLYSLFREKGLDRMTCIQPITGNLETHYHLILLEQLILILDILNRTNAIYESKISRALK